VSREVLVDRMADPGINVRTLMRLEHGDTRPSADQLQKLAAACSLPTGFFTADFKALEDPLSALSARIQEVADQVSRLEATIIASERAPKPARTKPRDT
jgi:transcriptional regulator with XRE-family HTH domain